MKSLAERWEEIEEGEANSQIRNGPMEIGAFLLLEKILGKKSPTHLIGSAEHDIVFLEVDVDNIKITDEEIAELIAYGVSYSVEYDCLVMYV